ncbi:MAG: PLP-dependent cysteine synthase family protein [Dehalogenimonas sp.]
MNTNIKIEAKTNKPDHRLRVYSSIINLIASEDNPTPLVRLNRLCSNPNFEIYLKLERSNPFGSIKDRIALEMLRELDTDGRTVIEPSSGNTGLAIAAIAASRGIPVEIAVPAGIPEDKKVMLRLLGVKLWETDDSLCPRFPSEGARGLVDAILRSPATRDGYISPNQYENQLNVRAHYRNTGPEIWRQTGGRVTHFFAGFGTCGTISGVGRYLKERNPDIRIVGVEPASAEHKLPGLKRISGLPPELVPKILDESVIDVREEVTDDEAYGTAVAVARKEGILVGPTTGAILATARRHAAKGPGMAVVISPDDAFKYGKFYADYLDKEENKNGN